MVIESLVASEEPYSLSLMNSPNQIPTCKTKNVERINTSQRMRIQIAKVFQAFVMVSVLF